MRRKIIVLASLLLACLMASTGPAWADNPMNIVQARRVFAALGVPKFEYVGDVNGANRWTGATPDDTLKGEAIGALGNDLDSITALILVPKTTAGQNLAASRAWAYMDFALPGITDDAKNELLATAVKNGTAEKGFNGRHLAVSAMGGTLILKVQKAP